MICQRICGTLSVLLVAVAGHEDVSSLVQTSVKTGCQCLVWKDVYEQNLAKCGQGHEFTFIGSKQNQKAKKEVCANFFERFNERYCVQTNMSSARQEQWCYVSSGCPRLHGGAPINQTELSWKICDRKDKMLAFLKPVVLKHLATASNVDPALLVKLAYPTTTAELWWPGVQMAMGRQSASGNATLKREIFHQVRMENRPVVVDSVDGRVPFGVVWGKQVVEVKRSQWFHEHVSTPEEFVEALANSTSLDCLDGCPRLDERVYKGCHTAMVNALMRAPVDRFFDRTPVGRIMNRASNDMMNVDLQVFTRLCAIMGMAWSVIVPLVYVHLVMPPWFTVASIPCYWVLFCLLRMYWRTMVPLRYLSEVCKSVVNAKLAEVEVNNPSVRAYRKSDAQLAEFQMAVTNLIGARFASGTALRCWLAGRLLILGGFFVTSLALLIIWVPGVLDVGRASLCLMGVFSILSGVEGSIDVGASAQYQLIAMNRIHEYTKLPEERAEVLVADKTLSDVQVNVRRSALGSLMFRRGSAGLEVIRQGTSEIVLQQVPGRAAFIAVPGGSLEDLAPGCNELRLTDSWHRITACNDAFTSAEALAEEICNGDSLFVYLQIRSGWLADGVAMRVHQLTAAYASSPGNVLDGVDLSIPRRCKAALVGEAGSGKTTLLLCVIRMLEPSSGRILLEGVSTQRAGLRTLRSAVGLVPQDPLLLQGSLRTNLDPFGQCTDARLWEALQMVQLEDHIKTCDGGLDMKIEEDGTNVSFGHRQLLCLARLVLRQPNLLLLDDAFSALDLHTLEAVRGKVWEAFPDSTVLAVERRLQTVLDFDLAVVMSRGKVVEQGSPKELLEANDSWFARMLAAEGSTAG